MDALQAGITAAREGRQAEAQTLLQQALQADPRSQQGWLWMSAVVETDAERRICLERVLAINPHNQTAQVRLEKLMAGNGQEREEAAVAHTPAGPVAGPPSSHTMPTLGMTPAVPDARSIRRLAPQPDPVDDLARLRAAQVHPQSSSQPTSHSQSDSFMALVLIGGLSITAIGGALMLALLWLIGWPP